MRCLTRRYCTTVTTTKAYLLFNDYGKRFAVSNYSLIKNDQIVVVYSFRCEQVIKSRYEHLIFLARNHSNVLVVRSFLASQKFVPYDIQQNHSQKYEKKKFSSFLPGIFIANTTRSCFVSGVP